MRRNCLLYVYGIGRHDIRMFKYFATSLIDYRLAICACYTQDHDAAEEAPTSLFMLSADTTNHEGYLYDATHLLSILCIRAGKMYRAQSRCERALRGRRKLLGKESDVAQESTALMAHIHVGLNNHQRAKTVLSIIPKRRRSVIFIAVKDSLRPYQHEFVFLMAGNSDQGLYMKLTIAFLEATLRRTPIALNLVL